MTATTGADRAGGVAGSFDGEFVDLGVAASLPHHVRRPQGEAIDDRERVAGGIHGGDEIRSLLDGGPPGRPFGEVSIDPIGHVLVERGRGCDVRDRAVVAQPDVERQ